MGRRPLAGEHDCLLTFPVPTGSIDEKRGTGIRGLPLVAEGGLSCGSDVIKFGGASAETLRISEAFVGTGFTSGELEFLVGVVEGLMAMEEEDGRRVGVAALGVGL